MRQLRVLMALALAVLSLLQSMPAEAANLLVTPDCSRVVVGRCMNEGYASGQGWYDTSSGYPLPPEYLYADATSPLMGFDEWAFPPACLNQAAIAATYPGGIPPACVPDPNYVNVFITQMFNNINGAWDCQPEALYDNVSACSMVRRKAIGSASLIDIMMGVPGPAVQGGTVRQSIANAVSRAQTLFRTWEGLVRAYDVRGLVDWHLGTTTLPFHTNTTSFNNASDVGFFIFKDPYPIIAIMFYKMQPNGSRGAPFFEINRACANLSGAMEPFPDFNYEATLYNNPIAPNTIVQPGDTLTFDVGARNLGPAIGPDGRLTGNVLWMLPAQGVPQPLPGQTQQLYNNGAMVPILPGEEIRFNGAMNYTIPAGLPEGSRYCFYSEVSPSNNNGDTHHTPYDAMCFTMYVPHYPGIIGTGGDIHAGGGLCGQPATNASITTRAANQSLTEYVLSANGAISSFGSNNGAGSSAATLGRTGNYAEVCRPDLVQIASNYVNSGGASYTTLAAGSYNVASLPGAVNDLYVYNGSGNINLTGTFNRKITIVALNGTITINGNIILGATSTSGANVPSLGLIAKGDILINPAATRVDAYVFSDSTINTCNAATPASCLGTLTVNGFLMGHSISFRRLGPATGATATVGEQINLTGQLYLNPPRFFDNTATLNLLQGLGEKPPLN